MDLNQWFEDETRTLDTTSIKEFEGFVEQYLEARGIKAGIEEQLAAQNKILQKMEGKLRTYLEAQNLNTHKTRLGTLIINERNTFKAPEGEERQNVVEKLREDGQLETIMAFNANKFSSWYKEQLSANPEFSLPGVKEEKLVYMSFRPAK